MTALGDLRTSYAEPGVRSPLDRVPTRLGVLGVRLQRHWAAVLAALVCGVLRIPFLGVAPSPDEAGFSIVGTHWAPGPELYGHYWVDRPPLLVALFGAAARLGPEHGVRLLGIVAAATATLAVGLTADVLGGPKAERWAAAAAAVALSTPLFGATIVNGELLAAPFVAASMLFLARALRVPDGRSQLPALLAGATAVAAALVKQNMIDGIVLVAVVLLLLVRRRDSRARAVRIGGSWLAGAGATLAVVLGAAASAGASPAAVWFAMYPFRLQATRVLAGPTLHDRLAALGRLAELELLSLGPVFVAALAWFVWRRRASADSMAAGIVAVAAYDVVSIAAGGSYWSHYLVQLVVPTSLAIGLVVSRQGRAWAHLALVFLLACTLSWATSLTRLDRAGSSAATGIGDAIADVARPGDTIVSAFGDADIVAASGLRSPYPYLWSLPARTLDHHFHRLARLLGGHDAPTWLVVRGPRTEALLDASATGPALRSRYEQVGDVCGRRIFLLATGNRPVRTLERPVSCSSSAP